MLFQGGIFGFVPNDDNHTLFLALDFAVCTEEGSAELVPRLIEMQAFLLCLATRIFWEISSESITRFLIT